MTAAPVQRPETFHVLSTGANCPWFFRGHADSSVTINQSPVRDHKFAMANPFPRQALNQNHSQTGCRQNTSWIFPHSEYAKRQAARYFSCAHTLFSRLARATDLGARTWAKNTAKLGRSILRALNN